MKLSKWMLDGYNSYKLTGGFLWSPGASWTITNVLNSNTLDVDSWTCWIPSIPATLISSFLPLPTSTFFLAFCFLAFFQHIYYSFCFLYHLSPGVSQLGWAELHAWALCFLSGEAVAHGLELVTFEVDEAVRKDQESWGPPQCLLYMAQELWQFLAQQTNWKLLSMYFSSPWNSHQWPPPSLPPTASQHLSHPWLSSTVETWKSFKYVLVFSHLSFPKYRSFILQ